jgi:hypothetical protein
MVTRFCSVEHFKSKIKANIIRNSSQFALQLNWKRFSLDLSQNEYTNFTLNWIALIMDNSVRSNDAVRFRISSDNFKFDSSHPTANNECIVFVDWTISFKEVGLQVNIKEISEIAK